MTTLRKSSIWRRKRVDLLLTTLVKRSSGTDSLSVAVAYSRQFQVRAQPEPLSSLLVGIPPDLALQDTYIVYVVAQPAQKQLNHVERRRLNLLQLNRMTSTQSTSSY